MLKLIAVLSALAYQDMNARRNQLEGRKTQHFEWIWRKNHFPDPTDIENLRDFKTSESQRKRSALAGEWGFDANNDDIWKAIEAGCKNDLRSLCRDHCYPGFLEWIESEETLFWITGKPASGKSSLIKYLSSDTKCKKTLEAHTGKSWEIIHFFYDFRAHQNKANSIEGMLRALLFQLVQKDNGTASFLLDDPEMKDLFVQGNEMSMDMLETAFQASLLNISCNLCIFVDGLDEFEGSIPDLLDVIMAFVQGNRVKICLASRPEPEIEHCLTNLYENRAVEDVKSLRMQDYNQFTIAKYVHSSIRKMRNTQLGDKEMWFIVASIVSGASGVILWAQLVCGNIVTGVLAHESLHELGARLQSSPRSLNDFYARMLHELDQHSKFESILTLRLVASWNEDLTMQSCDWWHLMTMLEICQKLGYLSAFPRERLNVEVFKARLRCRVGGLIDLIEHHDEVNFAQVDPNFYVRLVHKTLLVYLETSNLFKTELPEPLLNRHLWLRLYCDYLQSAPLLSAAPLVQRKEVRSNSYADLRTIASSRLIDIAGENSRQKVGWPGSVSHLSSELQDAVHSSLLTDAMCAHIVHPFSTQRGSQDCHCTNLDVDKMVGESVADRALLMCFAHSLWDYASRIVTNFGIGQRIKAFALNVFLDKTKWCSEDTVDAFDHWIDLLKTESSFSGLFLVNSRMVLSHRAHGNPTSRMLAQNMRNLLTKESGSDNQDYNPFVINKDHALFALLWKESTLYERLARLLTYCEFHPIFTVVTWLFMDRGTISRFRSRRKSYTVRWFISWLKLIIFLNGGNLNSFCYPNGTILHLIAEKYICEHCAEDIAIRLIGLGADVSIKGPKGTPLDIARSGSGLNIGDDSETQSDSDAKFKRRQQRYQNFVNVLNDANGRQQTRVDMFDEEWMWPEYWLSPKCIGYDASGNRN